MLKQTQAFPTPLRFDRTWHAGPPGRSTRPVRFAWLASDRTFWVLAGWLTLVFLLGGGSRNDIQSLMILRPLSVLVLAYGLAGLSREQIAAHRFLLGLAATWLTLHLLQLVPLPPQLWQALPGRGIVTEIDRAAGLGAVWRPLSLAPHGTGNAAWALLAPLAVLVLGVRLSPADRARLLPLLIGIGVFSALLGGLQLLGDPEGGLYFYQITNRGSAVGLFANRNHQAIFLAALPPMLFAWAALRARESAASSRMWWGAAAALTVFVIPLILVTGSRAGLLTSLLCLLAAPAVLAGGQAPGRGAGRTLLLLVLAAAGLVLLTVMLGRGLAFERLLGSAESDDLRFRVLPTLLAMIRLYSPWGTGFGSFTEVYELHEPQALLAPVYLNHAHNDWLELVLTGGWPAVALALVAAAGCLIRLARLVRPADAQQDARELLLGRLGLLVLLMLALASLGDYPLRTPSLACLAAVVALWAAPARPPRNPLHP